MKAVFERVEFPSPLNAVCNVRVLAFLISEP